MARVDILCRVLEDGVGPAFRPMAVVSMRLLWTELQVEACDAEGLFDDDEDGEPGLKPWDDLYWDWWPLERAPRP